MNLPEKPITVRTHCSPEDRNARKKHVKALVGKGHLGREGFRVVLARKIASDVAVRLRGASPADGLPHIHRNYLARDRESSSYFWEAPANCAQLQFKCSRIEFAVPNHYEWGSKMCLG